LQALLFDELNEESSALEKLNEALTLAEPGEFIRPFLDLGQAMAGLLKRLATRQPDLDYAKQILAAFDAEKARPEAGSADDQRTAPPGGRADDPHSWDPGESAFHARRQERDHEARRPTLHHAGY